MLPAVALGQNHPAASHIWEQAAYGNIPGITLVNLSGFNGGITTTYEPLTPESAAYTIRAAAMTTPYCASSDNTNDKAAGTGALTINVSGVNTSYAAFSETVTMNGQTSATLATANVLFINSISVLTTGSTGANTGTIRCGTGVNTAGVPAVVEAHMPIGLGRSQQAMYAVPNDYTLLCRNFALSSYGVTAAQTVQFAIQKYVDPVGSTTKVLTQEILGYINQAGTSGLGVPGIRKFAEKTVFYISALSAASTGPVAASAECLLISDAWEATSQVLF